jgi:hypothetical protein
MLIKIRFTSLLEKPTFFTSWMMGCHLNMDVFKDDHIMDDGMSSKHGHL